MIDRIGNELIVASIVMHTNSVDRIAGELQYSPVLIINALYQAQRDGKIDYNEADKTFAINADVAVESLALTEQFIGNDPSLDVKKEIIQLIRNLNSTKVDMSAEELSTWLPGASATRLKMFAYTEPTLTTYELADPIDKESVYTFITLKENAGKQFGKNQFNKKKAAKHIKAATDRSETMSEQ